MRKFILFIIFLAMAAGLAGLWYSQKNIYSREILKLEILGPTEAETGQEIEYIVRYKNNGDIRLEEPRLIFEYPKYSIIEGGKALRYEIELEDDIYPGEEQSFSFKARVLGAEGESRRARAWLNYRPKNLKARYESETSLATIIKKVPLVFEFDLPTKVEAGKELRFRLNYFSNIDYSLPDLRCFIEYPTNFRLTESVPAPKFGGENEQAEWELGPLNSAEGGRIELVGILSGEVGGGKTFKAKLGVWLEGEFVLLKETIKVVEIVHPSLYISQQINGNPQYIASPQDLLHYEIFFKNVGREVIRDMFLVVKLEGRAFNFETLKSPSGNFKLGDNSIVWDWRQVPKLQFLDAQEEGKVEFWVELKEDWGFSGAEDKNPVFRSKIYLSQAQEEFLTKVNSKLLLQQRGWFKDEVFGNSGPLPPKVGETTTYTIIWQARNYYNDVKNVKVKATLPQGARLTGKIFPEEQAQKFTFDSKSRELVWNVGDLEPGGGILSPVANIAFQLSFTPDESQRGKAPEIIGPARLVGEDGWTEQILSVTASAINTILPDDETLSGEQGIVQ